MGISRFIKEIKREFESHLWHYLKPFHIGFFSGLKNCKNFGASPTASVFILATFFMKSAHKEIYPYNPAKLVVPKSTSKDQRWVIKFYVWNIKAQRKELRREYDLNKIADLKERRRVADQRIKEINKALREGAYYDPDQTALEEEKKKGQDKQKVLNVAEALHHIIEYKGNKKKWKNTTITSYYKKVKKLEKFLDFENLAKKPIHNFTTEHFKKFLAWLKDHEGVSNRYHNNFIGDLGILFSHLNNEGYIDQDPTKHHLIERLKTGIGRNFAFSEEQMRQQIEFMREHDKDKYLFLAQFMYYTLIRTEELSTIQVKNIGQFHEDKIFLRSVDSKNGIDRHITIHPDLKEIFIQRGIYDLHPDEYLFGHNLLPDKKPINSKYIGHRYRRNVLNKLGFSKNYTFYSWKHSGVVAAWYAGLSKAAIMNQTGHRSSQSFDVYLKSLGLIDNEEFKNHYPSLP